MSVVTEEERKVFKAFSDILIPNAEGMPAASEVGVHEELLDKILALRSELVVAFKRGLAFSTSHTDFRDALEKMNNEDSEAFGAISLVASAGYYMTPKVRQLIGYPGQEKRPPDPDEEPEYLANGMLQVVLDRGLIFRKTPY